MYKQFILLQFSASSIPKTEVQSFLDSIVTEMEEFHDSLEDITISPKQGESDNQWLHYMTNQILILYVAIPKITITNESSSTLTESTSSTNNPISGDIEQYLEGYGGDDYGALSSTNIAKSPSKVRTRKKRHQETEDVNSVEVHTSLGSSEEKASLENLDKLELGLPSDEESISDQIKRFQLSIKEKEEAEALLIVCVIDI